MSGERRLIVNADDFGRSPGINAGIVECHLEGIVTSTTLMVNLPWTGDAVHRLTGCPRLGVGLHLNYCYGYPVAPRHAVSSLVDSQGAFMTDTEWLARHADAADIVTETNAQLARFRDLLGRAPTHMDSHKYLHSALRFRHAVIGVALGAGVALRAVTDDDRHAIVEAGVKTSDRFEGRFHGLDGDGVSQGILSQALSDAPIGVTELMCHPGYVDEHLNDSSYAADRRREMAALRDQRTFALLGGLDIRLTTFEDI